MPTDMEWSGGDGGLDYERNDWPLVKPPDENVAVARDLSDDSDAWSRSRSASIDPSLYNLKRFC